MLGQSSKIKGVNEKIPMRFISIHMLIQKKSFWSYKSFHTFFTRIHLDPIYDLFSPVTLISISLHNTIISLICIWMNFSAFFFHVSLRSIGRRVQGAVDCQRKKRSQTDHGGKCDEEIRSWRQLHCDLALRRCWGVLESGLAATSFGTVQDKLNNCLAP